MATLFQGKTTWTKSPVTAAANISPGKGDSLDKAGTDKAGTDGTFSDILISRGSTSSSGCGVATRSAFLLLISERIVYLDLLRQAV